MDVEKIYKNVNLLGNIPGVLSEIMYTFEVSVMYIIDHVNLHHGEVVSYNTIYFNTELCETNPCNYEGTPFSRLTLLHSRI